MSWMYYLLEANLYLIIFYALYYLVLRRETWHQYNRAYLLGSSALAFIIPIVQLGFLKPIPSAELAPQLLTAYSYVAAVKAAPVSQPAWNRDDILLAAYLVIVCCLLTGLAVKITKLLLLSRKGPARDFGKWKMVKTDMERGAFSFFNYLFLSADMAASDTVITHELVHIRQNHSWDIIYLELFRIVNWFNPVAYLLQHSIKELHEFIADEAITGSKEQIDTYTDFLVANAYGTYEHQLTNNLFNQSLLKKRIMMLHQKRSGNTARLKYLLALPLVSGLLCASTLAFAKDYGWVDIAPGHLSPEKVLLSTTHPTTKIKRLKVTQGTISSVTDKISVRESKGVTSTFTVKTLTEGDKVRLLKNYNIKVEVVEVVSQFPALPTAVSFPLTIRADQRGNKSSIEDIIPVLGKGATGFIIDPNTYSFKTLAWMSSKFDKKGYKMDFDEYKDDENKPMLMISLRKTDSKPNSGASATFRLDDLKKNGYAIFVGADPNKNLIHVQSSKFHFLKNDTSQITRKGIDSTIRGKINSTINKQIDSIVGKNNTRVKGEIKSRIDQQIQKTSSKLLPPSGYFSGSRTLYTYLAKHMRYPAKYFEQKIVGNVIVEFTTGADYKCRQSK